MLTKFLFVFFVVGCSQALEIHHPARIADDNDGDEEYLTNSSENGENFGGMDLNSDEMDLFVNGMSECCIKAVHNISILEDNMSELEQVNYACTQNVTRLVEEISKLREEKEIHARHMNNMKEFITAFEGKEEKYKKELDELTTTVLALDERRKRLEQQMSEIQEKNMLQNHLSQN